MNLALDLKSISTQTHTASAISDFSYDPFNLILGERIMAFADLVLDSKQYPLGYTFDAENPNFPLEDLRLLGVMGLMDPPREEVC